MSFKYPGNSVYTLKDINFKIHAGESLGIMGPVGAGKTTLLHLLTRLYPLSEGRILINGEPLETYTQESLRNIFLLVPQEPFLFSDSISDNIGFGVEDNISPEEVLRMTKIVDLHNEIEALPSQYESQLGERGVNLSGGQKQRLTIARGLIMKTPVLILDDSLSAVDTRTEKSIESELRQSRTTLTRIVVAHRLSSVRNSDKLLILKDGAVEAFGTFGECLKQSPTLQTIVRIQGQEASHE
ncbi:Lipid A export ATP-binding/permease protein MsbA [compost metagenome]